jgi:hypothetical protein
LMHIRAVGCSRCGSESLRCRQTRTACRTADAS